MREQNKFHIGFYVFLLMVFLGSLSLIAYTVVSGSDREWRLFSQVFLAFHVLNVWYLFAMLFINDFKTLRYPEYDGGLISVVMPCFNEEANNLERSLHSLVSARGNKEIIVINDGSDASVIWRLKHLAAIYPIQVVHFSRNKGKRHALHHAIATLVNGKYVVTVDSDTLVDRDALVRIVEPLGDPSIGAVSSDVRLVNEWKNALTRMIGAYYWIAIHMGKRAQSAFGIVTCCSGCLAAYRTDLVKGFIDEYLNQTFFGGRCTHSEDRHMTNLVLKRGYRVVFNERAVSYTTTPSTLMGFLRQQQRWKRGYVRESIYALSFAWKLRPLLFFEVMRDFLLTFASVGFHVAVLIILFVDPWYFIKFLAPVWILFSCVRNIFLLFYAKEKIPGMVMYTFFNDIVMYWQNIIALFTLKNKRWLTR